MVYIPAFADECHNKEGWAYDAVSGMCYMIVDTELAWNDARDELNKKKASRKTDSQ